MTTEDISYELVDFNDEKYAALVPGSQEKMSGVYKVSDMHQLTYQTSKDITSFFYFTVEACTNGMRDDCKSEEEIINYFGDKQFIMYAVQNFIDFSKIESDEETLKQVLSTQFIEKIEISSPKQY